MAFFKSEEERAQAAAERAAQEAEEEAARQEKLQERARIEWLATPIGQATAALQAGQRFLEVQLSVGRQEREAMWGMRDYDAQDQVISSAAVLGEIEALGWRLEHAGYIFRVSGESSSSRMFVSGEQTSVSGETVGIYLFRNASL